MLRAKPLEGEPEKTLGIFGVMPGMLIWKSTASPSASSANENNSFPVIRTLQNTSPRIMKMKPITRMLVALQISAETVARPIVLLFFLPLAKTAAKYAGASGSAQGEAKTLSPRMKESSDEGDMGTGEYVCSSVAANGLAWSVTYAVCKNSSILSGDAKLPSYLEIVAPFEKSMKAGVSVTLY